MRPCRPGWGTVSNAQLLTLPETINTSAPGVVTTQLSHPPPASSSATDALGSSESRPATAQPPEPPPTTTKSNASVTRIPQNVCCWPSLIARSKFKFRHCRDGPKDQARNLEIPRCAIAHLRFDASHRPGMTASKYYDMNRSIFSSRAILAP